MGAFSLIVVINLLNSSVLFEMTLRVMIVGARGSLGSNMVSFFKQKNCWMVAVGFESSELAHENISLTHRSDFKLQAQECSDQCELMKTKNQFESRFLDAVVCVAGGWRGGNAASENFISGCDDVIKQSVWSSLISAQIASTHLKPEGLLVLSGAAASTGSTPYMMGYGMAKAAVHQLTKSLAAQKSGLPENSNVACLLIGTLDTELNRKGMSKADFSKWTSLDFISDLVYKWTSDKTSRMTSGSLVELKTVDSQTSLNCL